MSCFPHIFVFTITELYNGHRRKKNRNSRVPVFIIVSIMTRIPHVAILVETSREYGRGLLRGISQYLKDHRPWSVYFVPQGLGDQPPRWLSSWKGDGILARISDSKMAKAIVDTGLPVVDLRNTMTDVCVPRLGPDNLAVSKMAFDHLLDRGFQNFGFWAFSQGKIWFFDARRNHFKKLVKDAGYEYHEFRTRDKSHRKTTWEQEQEQIAKWLQNIPKPIGIMTYNDDIGLQMLDACLRTGVKVPDDVAVVSVDNDEYLCSLSNPSLTSIDINLELIGYEAAALLDRIMAGEKAAKEYTEFQPRSVIVRESTDVLAIDNAEVASALRFIRTHACDPISVEQVVQNIAVSRSTIDRLFQKVLGRSPKEEIVRVQVNRAKELLAYSNLSLSDIAQKSGFSTFSHFSLTFRKHVGQIPREYRKQFKTTAKK